MSSEAVTAATRAATAAGVTISVVADEATARAASEVLATVWQTNASELVNAEMAWVLAHTSNYVAVARDEEGSLLGASVGIRAADDAGAYLHSHVTGLVPTARGGAGYALKLHQRAWAMRQGLSRIAWTFDPLLSRNAYFNVTKLGAIVTTYYRDFYGVLVDGINRGDHTDRCLVTWNLVADRVLRALRDSRTTAKVSSVHASPALLLREDGGPKVIPTGESPRLVAVPHDAAAMRQQYPALAREWRLALRDVLEQAFADGLVVTSVTRGGEYLLARQLGQDSE